MSATNVGFGLSIGLVVIMSASLLQEPVGCAESTARQAMANSTERIWLQIKLVSIIVLLVVLLVGIGLVLYLLSTFLCFLCSLMACLFSSALHGMAGVVRCLLRRPASILGRILGGVAGVLHVLLGTLVFLALQKCERRSKQRGEQENGESAFRYAH